MNNEQTTNKKQGFRCSYCRKWVDFSKLVSKERRNHCPLCLWSKHVDLEKAGDRKSECKEKMKPIGLTFKQKRADKWGRRQQGEIMLIHQCLKCGKISINMIAADDNEKTILKIFKKSASLDNKMTQKLKKSNIELLRQKDKQKIITQLFGKN